MSNMKKCITLCDFKHIIKEDHIGDLIDFISDIPECDGIDFSDESMALIDVYAYSLNENFDKNSLTMINTYQLSVLCDKTGENIVMLALAKSNEYHIRKFNIHTGTNTEDEVLHLIKYFILTVVMEKSEYLTDKDNFSRAAEFICTILNI